jgi:hypothetical protein
MARRIVAIEKTIVDSKYCGTRMISRRCVVENRFLLVAPSLPSAPGSA